MGFIVSRLYRKQSFFILVLRPDSARKYMAVEEFFGSFFSTFKIIYRHTSEYLTYNKIAENSRVFSVVEMHDRNHSSLFWDCVTGMHSIVYFIEILAKENMLEIIGQIKSLKDANTEASMLLVVINNNLALEEYVYFRKSLKTALEGAIYKVVDGIASAREKSLLTKDDIQQGFSWMMSLAD